MNKFMNLVIKIVCLGWITGNWNYLKRGISSECKEYQIFLYADLFCDITCNCLTTTYSSKNKSTSMDFRYYYQGFINGKYHVAFFLLLRTNFKIMCIFVLSLFIAVKINNILEFLYWSSSFGCKQPNRICKESLHGNEKNLPHIGGSRIYSWTFVSLFIPIPCQWRNAGYIFFLRGKNFHSFFFVFIIICTKQEQCPLHKPIIYLFKDLTHIKRPSAWGSPSRRLYSIQRRKGYRDFSTHPHLPTGGMFIAHLDPPIAL